MLYKLPIAVGALTVGSIVGSTVMSHKAQASIMSMAVLADQGWRRYKHQVKSTLGLDTHENVLRGLANKRLSSTNDPMIMDENDPRELFYEEMVGFFKAKPEDVIAAAAELNEMLNTDYRNQLVDIYDFVTIGTFLKMANAELLDTKVNLDSLENWGWTMDQLVECYNWCWIHMKLTEEKTDDGVVPFRVISWLEEPIIIDREQVYGGMLNLNGFSVDDIDEILQKKYNIQENLAIMKDNPGGNKK
jgi:hypothetical protein